MKKLKQLKIQLMRYAGIAVAAIALSAGIAFGVGSLATSAAEKKSKAEAQLNQDRGSKVNFETQMSKSGQAEKRYAEIIELRYSSDFSANSSVLKELMKNTKDRLRLASTFKLLLPTDKLSDRPEFSGMNYDISVREGAKVEFDAISDLHVFEFIDVLQHHTPGLVRINRYEIKRQGDLDSKNLTSINNGEAPELVSAAVEFRWTGVTTKKKDAQNNPAPPPDPFLPGGGAMP